MRSLLAVLVCVIPLEAGTGQWCVDAAAAEAWQKVVKPPLAVCDGAARQKIPAPRVNREVAVASATRAPWIVANGWRFLRKPDGRYFYELPAGSVSLAMAEAFAYGANAGFKIDAAEIAEAGRMVEFLRSLPETNAPALADFGFLDNGTGAAGEAMNLMTRRNLLYAVVSTPDSRYALTVAPGSREFPSKLLANPGNFAAAVRQRLTDDKRSVRLYGSEMAIIRALGDGKTARLHVINYSNRPLEGIRLRVRGRYAAVEVRAFAQPDARAEEFTVDDDFSEFSIPRIGVYAVVDLR